VTVDLLTRELPKGDAASYGPRTPPVLLPYQQRWIADESPLKIAEKSRRIGLTWAEASDNVLAAAKAKGCNVYYIGYNMDMAIEYIEACAMWARVFGQAASAIEESEEVFKDGDDEKAIKTYTIRFASGYRIVALSSRPANLRGKQGIVVIDEAAFHGQLGELLKAALALLIWGGRVRVISTHNGDQNEFNELINDIRAGARRGSVHRTTFDDAVSEGLCRRVFMRSGAEWSAEAEAAWVQSVRDFYGDAAEEELDVVPSQGSGAWLTSALIEARMRPVPVFRYACPPGFERRGDGERWDDVQEWLELEVRPVLEALDPDLQSVWGMDFGRSGDLTVIAPCQIDQQLRRVMPCQIELRNMPHRQQEQVVNFVTERLPRFCKAAIDAKGNGHAVAEFSAQKFGWSRVELVMPSEGWYREQMPSLKQAFEDDTIRVPRDKDTLADLRAIKMIKGVARVPDVRSTGKDGGKRHGDAAIAIALMHYASRHPGAPIEFTPVPRRTRGYDSSDAGDSDIPNYSRHQGW
jgi:phage FluMu gp28-like protein